MLESLSSRFIRLKSTNVIYGNLFLTSYVEHVVLGVLFPLVKLSINTGDNLIP
jgi:hypothetical protein